MRVFLIIMALMIGGLVLSNLVSPPTPHQTVVQTAGPRCDVEGAGRLVTDFQRKGLFYKIDTSSSIPKLYVGDLWDSLMIDDKQTFDGVLQCWFGNGKESVILVYRDARTGREVASSSGYGFEMK